MPGRQGATLKTLVVRLQELCGSGTRRSPGGSCECGAWTSASRSSLLQLPTSAVCHGLKPSCQFALRPFAFALPAIDACRQGEQESGGICYVILMTFACAGILIAILVASAGGVSQCAWCVVQPGLQCSWHIATVHVRHGDARIMLHRYFVAYAFDTTVGVATAILLHSLVLAYCRCQIAERPEEEHRICHVLLDCGNYGEPSLKVSQCQSIVALGLPYLFPDDPASGSGPSHERCSNNLASARMYVPE